MGSMTYPANTDAALETADWAADAEARVLAQALKLAPDLGWTWAMTKAAGAAAGDVIMGLVHIVVWSQAFNSGLGGFVLLLSQPPLSGPIIGVTDGSTAAPGMVGEFIQGSTVITAVPNTGIQVLAAQPLTLTPGDWDVEALLYEISVVPQEASFILTPQPAGFAIGMTGWLNMQNASDLAFALILSNRAAASVSVNTPLNFNVTFLNVVTGGTASMGATARRMR